MQELMIFAGAGGHTVVEKSNERCGWEWTDNGTEVNDRGNQRFLPELTGCTTRAIRRGSSTKLGHTVTTIPAIPAI
jgi:hypothetical protein